MAESLFVHVPWWCDGCVLFLIAPMASRYFPANNTTLALRYAV